MSRALVALDALRELTDGTPGDLAALLVEVVLTQRFAGAWHEMRHGYTTTWSREAVVLPPRGSRFPAIVSNGLRGQWSAELEELATTQHPTPEAARAHCDERLRAAGWLLL